MTAMIEQAATARDTAIRGAPTLVVGGRRRRARAKHDPNTEYRLRYLDRHHPQLPDAVKLSGGRSSAMLLLAVLANGIPFLLVEYQTYEDARQGEWTRLPCYRLDNAVPWSDANPDGFRGGRHCEQSTNSIRGGRSVSATRASRDSSAIQPDELRIRIAQVAPTELIENEREGYGMP